MSESEDEDCMIHLPLGRSLGASSISPADYLSSTEFEFIYMLTYIRAIPYVQPVHDFIHRILSFHRDHRAIADLDLFDLHSLLRYFSMPTSTRHHRWYIDSSSSSLANRLLVELYQIEQIPTPCYSWSVSTIGP